MLALPAEQTSPTGFVARRERALVLAAALETLPEPQRTAVELRYLGECSLDEIVSTMGRSRAAVAGLLRRGLAALRDQLEHQV
jgi:RNA polymerase sigma-70 factor (ECF subfamily)